MPPYCHNVKREQFLKKRLTTEQRKILTGHSALYNRLPEDLKTKLEGLMHVFLHEVDFEVDGFSEVTEEMRICVAAEACVLILTRGYDSYSQLRRVCIYKKLVRKNKKIAGSANRYEVKLDWHSCLQGMRWGADNHNVILHEFAHVLDQADDAEAQSIPVAVDSIADRRKWKEVIAREYPKIKAAQVYSLVHTIDKYALTSNAEFFSCATESFFERSKELRQYNPEIYELLQDYYGLDPLQWEEAKSQRDSQLTFIKTFGPLLFLLLVTAAILILGMYDYISTGGILCCFAPVLSILLYIWWTLNVPTSDSR